MENLFTINVPKALSLTVFMRDAAMSTRSNRSRAKVVPALRRGARVCPAAQQNILPLDGGMTPAQNTETEVAMSIEIRIELFE